MAAQFRWYLVNGRDIASLEYLLDCPADTLCKAKKVVHLLGRRDCITVAVLLALILLVLRGGLLILLRRSLLNLLGLRIALLRVVVLLLNGLLCLRWQLLRRHLLCGRRQLHRLVWLLRRRVVVEFGLNASYSKKVPAEGEYSSQQYHCQIEVELPDGLNPQQLQEKVHNVFDFVRKSVETELHNNMPAQQPVQTMQLPPPVQQLPPQQQYYDPQANYQQPQPQPQQSPQNAQYQQTQNRQYRNANSAASPKQVNYLLSLAKRAGWTIQQILQRCNVPAVDQIPSKLCSQLIQEFSGTPA